MAEDDFLFGVQAMWHLVTPEQKKAGIALLNSFDAWELLGRYGMTDCMDQEQILDIAADLLNNSINIDAPERLQFSRLQAVSQWTISHRAQLWLSVLRHDDPAVTQFASFSGVPPNADGSLLIASETLLNISKNASYGQSYSSWLEKTSYTGITLELDKRKERIFTLAELVCMLGINDNFKTLIEFPEFMSQITQSNFCLHTLVQKTFPLIFIKIWQRVV